jgi:hypothetical protein
MPILLDALGEHFAQALLAPVRVSTVQFLVDRADVGAVAMSGRRGLITAPNPIGNLPQSGPRHLRLGEVPATRPAWLRAMAK